MATAKKSSDDRELDPTTRRILARLKKEREALGLSQAKVAELAQVETSYVGLLERRERVPSLPVLFRLAEAVGLTPGELLADANPDRPAELPELIEIRSLLATWTSADRKLLVRLARDLDRLIRRAST